MSFTLSMPKSRSRGRLGRLLLWLGLGGVASACGAFLFYRSNSRPRRNTAVAPGNDSVPETPVAEAPSNEPSLSEPGPEIEPWMESLRLAMDQKPLDFGYDKPEWTAPLLGRYLQDIRGFTVPVPRLRKALKDLGYQWEQTHYVQAFSATAQE